MDNLNIVIMGRSGTGKTTMAAAVFSKNRYLMSGIGIPTARSFFNVHTLPDSPVTIYESNGLGNSSIFDELYNMVKNRNSSENTKENIHLCWYCVRCYKDECRFFKNEVETINNLRQLIPVIIVITHTDERTENETNEFISEIKKLLNGNSIDIVPLMAVHKAAGLDFGQMNIKSHGLDKLVERSCALLPESVKKTLAAYQTVSAELNPSMVPA